MVEIEFILSVLVFVVSISFVTLVIVGNIPLLHNTATGENAKAMSFQYSEMLVLDEGYPMNWSDGNFAQVVRMGFSTGQRHVVDGAKISKMSVYCNDPLTGYTAVKANLGFGNDRDVVIEASRLNGSALFGSSVQVCGPPLESRARQQFHTNRLAVLPSGEIVKIRVTVIA
jgi:hypothetical protein